MEVVSDTREDTCTTCLVKAFEFSKFWEVLRQDMGWHFKKCALFRKISAAAVGKVILNLKRLHAGNLDMMQWHKA